MLVPRRIMAAMVLCFWGHMAAFPHDYTSGTYTVLSDLAPLRWWAIAFVLAGSAMLLTRHLAATVIVGGLMCAWGGGLAAAVATNNSQSPAGLSFIAGYVALLVWGAGRTPQRA